MATGLDPHAYAYRLTSLGPEQLRDDAADGPHVHLLDAGPLDQLLDHDREEHGHHHRGRLAAGGAGPAAAAAKDGRALRGPRAHGRDAVGSHQMRGHQGILPVGAEAIQGDARRVRRVQRLVVLGVGDVQVRLRGDDVGPGRVLVLVQKVEEGLDQA